MVTSSLSRSVRNGCLYPITTWRTPVSMCPWYCHLCVRDIVIYVSMILSSMCPWYCHLCVRDVVNYVSVILLSTKYVSVIMSFVFTCGPWSINCTHTQSHAERLQSQTKALYNRGWSSGCAVHLDDSAICKGCMNRSLLYVRVDWIVHCFMLTQIKWNESFKLEKWAPELLVGKPTSNPTKAQL